MSVVDRPGLSRVRVGLIGLGLLALVVGAFSVVPVDPLAGVLATAVERAGHDYVVAAGLGAVAVLLGAAVLTSGRGATMQQTEMPAVEQPAAAPAAGEPFDRTIGSWRLAVPVIGRSERSAVRERLLAAAVATIAEDEGCSRREARRRVDRRSWTDDRVAAAFLAAEPPSAWTWLVALSNGKTALQYRASRTVAAIVDRPTSDQHTNDGPTSDRRSNDLHTIDPDSTGRSREER